MIGLVIGPPKRKRNAGDLPAEVRPGQHQLSVVLNAEDAGKLTTLAAVANNSTWSDTVRDLIRAAYARMIRKQKRSGE